MYQFGHGCAVIFTFPPIYQRTSHVVHLFFHSHSSLGLWGSSPAHCQHPLSEAARTSCESWPSQRSNSEPPRLPDHMHQCLTRNLILASCSSRPEPCSTLPTAYHQHTPASSVPLTTLVSSECPPIRSSFRDPKGRHILAVPSPFQTMLSPF
jgi:hypothetical protein